MDGLLKDVFQIQSISKPNGITGGKDVIMVASVSEPHDAILNMKVDNPTRTTIACDNPKVLFSK